MTNNKKGNKPQQQPRPNPPQKGADPKPKPRKGKGKRKNKKMGKNSAHHSKITCSILDPFCVHAMNAKYPDGQSINTLTYQSRTTLAITTSASGYASLVFTPDHNQYNYLKDQTAPGTYDANFRASDSNLAGIISDAGICEQVRIVSAGIAIRWTYPSTVTRPTCIIADVSDPTDLFGTGVTAGVVSSIGQNTKVLIGNQDVYWVVRPIDASRRLYGLPIAGSTARSKLYNACLISINGANSTTYGVFELVINYEYTVKTNSQYNQFASAPPPANHPALQASVAVQKGMAGAVQAASTIDFTQFLEKKAMSALDTILNSGADFIMGALL